MTTMRRRDRSMRAALAARGADELAAAGRGADESAATSGRGALHRRGAMAAPSVREPSLPARIALAAATVAMTAALFAGPFAQACLPLWRTVLAIVVPEFRLIDLSVVDSGRERVVRARFGWQPVVAIGDRVLQPDSRGEAVASTTLGYATLGPAIAASVCLAWPFASAGRRRAEAVRRAAALAVACLVLSALDVPAVLAGQVWQQVLATFAPQHQSTLVSWSEFLTGGGRLALGIAAGVLAVGVGRRGAPVPRR